MKKFLLIAVMAMAGVVYVAAQPRAIGGRLGYGIEFSYEHGFGNGNMLSVDAGFPGLFTRGIGVEAAVTYDWINPFGADFSSVWSHKGEWNWYMGVGAGGGAYWDLVGGWHGNEYAVRNWDNRYFVGAAGRIGVEYNFWFPLQLSIDWRPIIGPEFGHNVVRDSEGNVTSNDSYVNFCYSGLYMGGVALSVRYKF